MSTPKARALELSAAEWHVLCDALSFTLRAPGPGGRPSGAAREAAHDSLVQRNILTPDSSSVARPVAALLFSLSHPRVAMWAHRHQEVNFSLAVSINHFVSALAWHTGDRLFVAPTSPSHVSHDVASVLGLIHGTGGDGNQRFSIAGGLWHSVLAQAPVASQRALASLAAAEGVDPVHVPALSSIAVHSVGRIDIRIVRSAAGRRWSGHEISFIPTPEGTWSVADGRAFERTPTRATTRATFARMDPTELLRGLL